MSASGKRVFVMDDSAFALDLTRVALAETGLDVICGRDLRDLERLTGQPVDLVLMDVEMPEAFGDDVATWLMGNGLTAPVYLLSGLPDDQLEKRARECGAQGWISKRSGIDQVIARIQRLLGTGSAAPSSAPNLVVGEFLSIAHGRLRRAEGALDRGDLGAMAAELHLLFGEASLLGQSEVARAAEEGQLAAGAIAGDGALSQGSACRVALAGIAEELEAAAARARVPAPPTAALPGRLLLVDDGDFYRSTLMSVLEDAGYQVVEARRVAEARHRMRDGRFDLAIFDQQVDDGRGAELIPELRAHAPSTRILLLSAAPGDAAGADRVLARSIEPDALLREIAGLIARP